MKTHRQLMLSTVTSLLLFGGLGITLLKFAA